MNIFVFGSNEGGRHGKGSAKFAMNWHGAIYGQAEGLQGTSYGIPTKDRDLNVLPLTVINMYVNRFIEFARKHRDLTFNVVEIGCGLAGYKPREIAPMFKDAPVNVNLPEGFKRVIYLPMV